MPDYQYAMGLPVVTRAALEEYASRCHELGFLHGLITRIERENPELFRETWDAYYDTEPERTTAMSSMIRAYALLAIQQELDQYGPRN